MLADKDRIIFVIKTLKIYLVNLSRKLILRELDSNVQVLHLVLLWNIFYC